MAKKIVECDNCGHPVAPDQDHFQYVMLGECADCPECDALLQARVAEARAARPAQYRPVD